MREKREQILNASVQLIQKEGLDIKIREVADLANVGKGTVYEYFSSKDELICETLLYLGHQLLELTETKVLKENITFEDSLKEYIKIQFNILKEQFTFFMLQDKKITSYIRPDILSFYKDRLFDIEKKLMFVINKMISKGVKEGLFVWPTDKMIFKIVHNFIIVTGFVKLDLNLFEEKTNIIKESDIDYCYNLVLKILS